MSSFLDDVIDSESNLDANEGIRVVIRPRPLFDDEIRPHRAECLQICEDGQTLGIQVDTSDTPRSFTFHRTFESDATQKTVFDECGIKTLVDRALDGYACTAFAFGQTGSGKTYTISGPERISPNDDDDDDDGIVQRAIQYLWHRAESRRDIQLTFQASYMEIYNEQVMDLLNPVTRVALPIRWKAERGFYVENLLQIECEDMETMKTIFNQGMKNRRTAAHELNDRSNRSHTILTILIDTVFKTAHSDLTGHPNIRHGQLNIVDLAGSERVGRTKTEGKNLIESNNINKSLMILGKCISALADAKKRKGHIPYRESALTMLLKDSLGGNGMTLMIACVSPDPASSQETHNTLRYASRAKRIKNKPIIRTDPQQQLIAALRREIRLLKTEITYLRHQGPSSRTQQTISSSSSSSRRRLLNDNNEPDHDLNDEDDFSALMDMSKEMTQIKILLQQYMQENEDLRMENVQLYSQQQEMKQLHQYVERENQQLKQQLGIVSRDSISDNLSSISKPRPIFRHRPAPRKASQSRLLKPPSKAWQDNSYSFKKKEASSFPDISKPRSRETSSALMKPSSSKSSTRNQGSSYVNQKRIKPKSRSVKQSHYGKALTGYNKSNKQRRKSKSEAISPGQKQEKKSKTYSSLFVKEKTQLQSDLNDLDAAIESCRRELTNEF